MTLPRAMPVVAPTWHELARSKHWTLAREPVRRIVRVQRTDVPFGDLTEWDTEFGVIQQALGIYDRGTHAMLLDMRAAPMRTDDAFNARVRNAQQTALNGFARTAILVRTAVGMLQLTRTRRENGREGVGVFHDEADAIAFLGMPRDRR